MRGAVRLTDVLTNAAAIADYTGATEVSPDHLLEAITHLQEGRAWSFDEQGAPRSPLGRSRQRATVPDSIQGLAQEWFIRLGNDPLAELDPGQLEELIAALRRLRR